MARPRTKAGKFAVSYGVSIRVINRLGADQFEAMSEDARELYIQWTRNKTRNGACPAGYKLSPERTKHKNSRSCAAAVERSRKTTADWMELMARSPQWWKDEPPKKKPVHRVEPIVFKTVPIAEPTSRISRMMQLAERIRA